MRVTLCPEYLVDKINTGYDLFSTNWIAPSLQNSPILNLKF